MRNLQYQENAIHDLNDKSKELLNDIYESITSSINSELSTNILQLIIEF